MATHNIFTGYAQVITLPRVVKNEDGEYVRASCGVVTLRGKRDYGNILDTIRLDTPVLRTDDPIQCREIENWKLNDMVEIKGPITSREITRTYICPECGAENKIQGVATFIHPIFCGRRESGITKDEGYKLLQYRSEISNNVTLIGMLMGDPSFRETEKGVKIGKYQVAVMRRYRIKEDEPSRKADFIWIKSFGRIAEKDEKFLKKGTLMYIDGVLQTKKYEKEINCASCNYKITADEVSTEVVPYACEYLRDYIPQKEDDDNIDPEEKAEDIFNNLF